MAGARCRRRSARLLTPTLTLTLTPTLTPTPTLTLTPTPTLTLTLCEVRKLQRALVNIALLQVRIVA